MQSNILRFNISRPPSRLSDEELAEQSVLTHPAGQQDTALLTNLLSEHEADSREEMRAHHEAGRKEHDADTNDDGVIDRTEFINAAQDRFDKLDENGDGVLSEDEKPGRRRHHRAGRG